LLCILEIIISLNSQIGSYHLCNYDGIYICATNIYVYIKNMYIYKCYFLLNTNRINTIYNEINDSYQSILIFYFLIITFSNTFSLSLSKNTIVQSFNSMSVHVIHNNNNYICSTKIFIVIQLLRTPVHFSNI